MGDADELLARFERELRADPQLAGVVAVLAPFKPLLVGDPDQAVAFLERLHEAWRRARERPEAVPVPLWLQGLPGENVVTAATSSASEPGEAAS